MILLTSSAWGITVLLLSEPEVTILSKRPCRDCRREIYLQFMIIPGSNMRWVAFDYPGMGLHDCIMNPLNRGIKKLIQQKLEEMNPSNTETSENDVLELVKRIDVIILNLIQIKDRVSKLK
jgi:hypothetical protein